MGDIGDVICAMDQTLRVDQVAVAAREVGKLVVAVPGDLIGRADCVVEVAQESERELLGSGEREILGGGVERRAEDGRAEFVEAFGAVTQRLTLDGSTWCGGLWVPPQQHPTPCQLGQVDDPVLLIGEREGWSVLSWAEHGSILPAIDTPRCPGRRWGSEAVSKPAPSSTMSRSESMPQSATRWCAPSNRTCSTRREPVRRGHEDRSLKTASATFSEPTGC